MPASDVALPPASATAGPWRVSKDCGQAVVRAGRVMVADCNIFGRNAPTEEQCAANAALIVAAVNSYRPLMEALIDMLDACSAGEIARARKKADAALSRARALLPPQASTEEACRG